MIEGLDKSCSQKLHQQNCSHHFAEVQGRLISTRIVCHFMPTASSDRVPSVKVVLLGEGPLVPKSMARPPCRPVPQRRVFL